MDLTPIVAWLGSFGPWGWVCGALVVVAYQFAKVKFPTLLAGLPHLVPLPPSPAPAPNEPAAPDAPAPAHPILDQLARLFGRMPGGATLADEVKSVFSILATLGHTPAPAEEPAPTPTPEHPAK